MARARRPVFSAVLLVLDRNDVIIPLLQNDPDKGRLAVTNVGFVSGFFIRDGACALERVPKRRNREGIPKRRES